MRNPIMGITGTAALLTMWLTSGPASAAATADYFQIQFQDDQTGRGVPLVEVETVHRVRQVSDSAGRIAFLEPGLMNQEVFFHVRSHGYEAKKDGFGYAGVRLTPKAGEKAVVKLKRLNVAERLYRITGEGLYRDSVLLGEPAPVALPLGAGKVAGQDSTLAAVYQGKLFWFWGDTSRHAYPLGNFWTSGATSELPGKGGLDPAVGVNLNYFTNRDGFCKAICPFEKREGCLIWIDGVLTTTNETGREILVCHYARLKNMGTTLEHGLAVFNDAKQEFEKVVELPLAERWRAPTGHPVLHDGHWYFGPSYRNVRVKATWEALRDPQQYEGLNFTRAGDKVAWAWKRDQKPLDATGEAKLVKAGDLPAGEARLQAADVETSKTILMHQGCVRWSPFRQRWIMIVPQSGGSSSYLGEIYYLEATDLAGPWKKARKIITHDKYTFYNPVQHTFFDQENGRVIYFEGTYTETFSGNPIGTPRYDYNQIMYRLDLADPRLEAAH